MEPLLALQLASMTIQGISSFFGQQAQNEQAMAQIESAYRTASWDMSALNDRATQLQDAAQLEMFERQKQALRERSKILTAAGEAGVSGSSVLRQLNQTMLDKSFDIGVYQTNLENSLFQTNLDAQKVISTANSRVNQASSSISNPWLSPLTIGTEAFTAYQFFKDGL